MGILKYTHKKVADLVRVTATKLKIHPQEVKKGQLFSADKELTDWTLRNLGGLKAIVDRFFPLTAKDHVEILETKEVNAYIKQLETKLAKRESQEKKLLLAVQENIKPLAKIVPRKFKAVSSEQERQVVVMLNDCHIGLIVNGDEINNVNSFGWQQACRRSALMLKETLNYKIHNRDQVTKVHLILNGDLIQGIIHGLVTDQMEKMVHQINGAVHIFSYLIAGLAAEFKEVEVSGLSGNHCDFPHKRENHKRVSAEKYDSYANIIFYALSAAFRNNENVKFNVTKGLFLSLDLPAGRAMACHGDTLFSRALGNPGTNINVKSLSDEIRKFNNAEISRGHKPVKLFLFGHVHSFCHFITNDGVDVYVAPSLSGTDAYSHGNFNANTNLIGQVVFESTPKYIIGDSRLVRLNEADNDKTLDELIPLFDNELKWRKP